jgi:pyruvate-ferredoxin/flavodoxin oxidoreductase
MHFFDGFRTSHEIQKIEMLSDDDLRAMIDPAAVAAHRQRALTPDHPVMRGTAQNPDTFFQAREAANPFYLACPDTVEKVMDRFAALTGRQYRLFEYVGHPQAERVIVIMGSGADTAHEAVDRLVRDGRKGRRPESAALSAVFCERFLAALPASVKSIAVMDRTKEPGSIGEPLYLDVWPRCMKHRPREFRDLPSSRS